MYAWVRDGVVKGRWVVVVGGLEPVCSTLSPKFRRRLHLAPGVASPLTAATSSCFAFVNSMNFSSAFCSAAALPAAFSAALFAAVAMV